MASRLSFGLWDSLPDAALLEAARSGQLRTSEQVSAQVRRMLPDDRTKAKLRDFLHHWLNIDHTDDIAKDKELFRGFDDELAGNLRTSLDLFLDDVIWNGNADFRQLLVSETWFVNQRIADYYEIAGEYGDRVPPSDHGTWTLRGDPDPSLSDGSVRVPQVQFTHPPRCVCRAEPVGPVPETAANRGRPGR